IAHDFNNILTPLLGFTDLALGEARGNPKCSGYLTEVATAGERARDLVSQILTFSRQNGHDFKPLEVGVVVDEALKLLRASLPSSIEIRTELLSRSLMLGNSTQIHQVLMNLCTNAAHAIGEGGGTLTVRLFDVEAKSQRNTTLHGTLPVGAYICLEVEDTGPGVPWDLLPRIFEPFFTTKEKGQGTGMGLAVLHGIVSSHGGHIDVGTGECGGALFQIYWPRVGVDLPAEKSLNSQPVRGRERILLVDDEPSMLEITREMLQTLGYSVTTAGNGARALELFEAAPGDFDIVITDMTMPVMSGDRLSAALLLLRPDIPIILCTGFSRNMDSGKTEGFGVRHLLAKPYTLNQIGMMVRQTLDTPRA
ncbi:MAG: response regulator, partial [Gammaproteobacteria bacterium]|nr:response regulator [Gammaproteobacteria bacterium]